MSNFKELITREIRARKDTIIGTVLTTPELVQFDGSVNGGETWVVRVDIGSNRVLEDVAIKAVDVGKFFSSKGQAVELRKTQQGRYEIIGPAPIIPGTKTVNTYDLNTFLSTATATAGFTPFTVPFEHYQGPQSMRGNPNVTFAASTISRAVGSFLTDGFPQTGSIRVANSPGGTNDGVFTLTSATALVLTFSGTPFTAGGPFSDVAVAVAGTSLWNDGVTGFPLTLVLDGNGNPV